MLDKESHPDSRRQTKIPKVGKKTSPNGLTRSDDLRTKVSEIISKLSILQLSQPMRGVHNFIYCKVIFFWPSTMGPNNQIPDFSGSIMTEREQEANPVFDNIVAMLSDMLEAGYGAGEYLGNGFSSKATEAVRDAAHALRIVKTLGPKAGAMVPLLIRFLERDTHWWLPHDAAAALGAMGEKAEPAIPRLASLMLADETAPKSCYGHYSAANALGDIGSSKAVPYLIEAAQDPRDQGPGWRAIIALGQLERKAIEALPTLKQLQKSPRFSEFRPTIDGAIKAIEGGKT